MRTWGGFVRGRVDLRFNWLMGAEHMLRRKDTGGR